MKWRTDKPTAKLIVADITGSRYPEVLKLGSDCYYGTVNHLPVDYDSIEKWADLEEDENLWRKSDGSLTEMANYATAQTMSLLVPHQYDFGEGIFEEVKTLMQTMFLCGVDYQKDIENNETNCSQMEDETVTDCNELEEELDKWRYTHFQGYELTSGEYLTRDSQLDLAHHFAKWGAEHLIDGNQ